MIIHSPQVLIIAEIGINHNGDIELAKTMIQAAKIAGADAVKFQSYHTEDFLSDETLTYTYRNQGQEFTESQYSMFKRCELSESDLIHLKNHADSCEIQFFSTPTNNRGVDILKQLGSPFLKNGSDFLGNLSLIRHMGASGIPTILSTGMAEEHEVAEAVSAFREAGGQLLTLLACTTSYPTPSEHVHLRRIAKLAQRFDCASGFSDHTEGWEAAFGAVCAGASIIEKHFTTDHRLPGPDQWFSSTSKEFSTFTKKIREAEKLLGSTSLRPTDIETSARNEFRLSCVAAYDLGKGSTINEANVAFRRPGTGVRPAQINTILGRKLIRPINAGELILLPNLRNV